MGMMKKRVMKPIRSLAVLLVLLGEAMAQVSLSPPAGRGMEMTVPTYVRKSTARDTWFGSLEAEDESKGVKKIEVTFGPWFCIGPFDNTNRIGFATVYPPERGIDLAATYPGKLGTQVKWQPIAGPREGQPFDLAIYDDKEYATVYLYCTVASATGGLLPVSFGSDDTITVWVNGKQVLAHEIYRAVQLGDERVFLPLRKGANSLLIKVCNGYGPTALVYCLGHVAPQGQQTPYFRSGLFDQIRRDFPPEEVHRLMVELDWLYWDRLTGPAPDFHEAASNALELARATLARVAGSAEHRALGKQLSRMEGTMASARRGTDWRELYFAIRLLRRRIALSDPLLAFERLLIDKRPPPTYSHMCDQYLGRHSRQGEGLVALDHWKEFPRATAIMKGRFPAGSTLHPDLSFDGRRVVFGFCDHTADPRRFFLWEMDIDGSAVRQITGAPGKDPMEGAYGRRTVQIEDFDPCYVPDGGIVFVSTRNQAFGRCHGGRYTPSYVLYRCDADGSNIRRISFGEANEWDPSVLHDGSIVYTRWDYINRHDVLFQSLWVTRPDGTGTAHYYGNYSAAANMKLEPRAIPGSTRIVCTAGAHHSYTAGSLFAVDNNLGLDGEDPIRRLTPEAPFPERQPWNPSAGMTSAYCAPWPLSVDLYLVAFSPFHLAGQGRVQEVHAYGIYLIDTLGGRELIYRDPDMSSFSPIPLSPRFRPPAVPSLAKSDQADGRFFVLDVYRGRPSEGTNSVPRGAVKAVRVVRIWEQPTAGVPGRSAVANEIVKSVVGTARVEADGSAAFHAPAGVPLLFQLLDENGMCVMNMRSQVYLQPGETAGCVGCHEPRMTSAPVLPARALNFRRLAPPPGPRYEGGLSFARTVQPVLDRYCIRCHGLGGRGLAAAAASMTNSAAAALLPLVGSPTGFNAAYDRLVRTPGLVKLAHRNSETWYSAPGDYGSHAGRLADVLLSEPHASRASMDRDSLERIAMWLDLNGQFYGDYSFNRAERRPHDAQGEKRLREFLSNQGGELAPMATQPLAALVNMAVPEESRALKAPLAVASGGWGQCKPLWESADASGYRELRALVLLTCGVSATGSAP